MSCLHLGVVVKPCAAESPDELSKHGRWCVEIYPDVPHKFDNCLALLTLRSVHDGNLFGKARPELAVVLYPNDIRPGISSCWEENHLEDYGIDMKSNGCI